MLLLVVFVRCLEVVDGFEAEEEIVVVVFAFRGMIIGSIID